MCFVVVSPKVLNTVRGPSPNTVDLQITLNMGMGSIGLVSKRKTNIVKDFNAFTSLSLNKSVLLLNV